MSSPFKIASVVILLAAIFVGYILADGIIEKSREEDYITSVENKIKRKLELIRDAQLGYFSVHGEYTSHFDSLKQFITKGEYPIIERKEKTLTIDYGSVKLDSTVITQDTIGTVAVKDSLLSSPKYSKFNIEDLETVPGSNGENTFEMKADVINENTHVFKVVDTHIINPGRRKAGKTPDPLKIGSLDEPKTKGNWE